jgi:hypothetical protein
MQILKGVPPWNMAGIGAAKSKLCQRVQEVSSCFVVFLQNTSVLEVHAGRAIGHVRSYLILSMD